MGKRLLISMGALAAFVFLGFLIFVLMMEYEPAPSKRAVGELAHIYDLEKFGPVEGSLLYTPRNYGFFNEYNIVVVEQSLGEGNHYGHQYVLIKPAEELAKSEKEEIQKDLIDKNSDIRSKHKIQVYKNGEKVEEEWYFKEISVYDGEIHLSFIPIETINENRFNFFTEGYTEFKDF